MSIDTRKKIEQTLSSLLLDGISVAELLYHASALHPSTLMPGSTEKFFDRAEILDVLSKSEKHNGLDDFSLSVSLSQSPPTLRCVSVRLSPHYFLGWMVPKEDLHDVLISQRGDSENDALPSVCYQNGAEKSK